MKPNGILASWVSSPLKFFRNFDCWLSPKNNFDLSGYAFSIESVGTTGGGVLISRRHIISAAHIIGDGGFQSKYPKQIWFTNNKNQTFEYTILGQETIYKNGANTDLCVCLLDREVDSSICHYKVLPPDWTTYLKSPIPEIPFKSNYSETIPCFYSNQLRTIGVGDLSITPSNIFWKISSSYNALIQPKSLAVMGGDSGNPIFCKVKNELVLLGAWYTGTPNSVNSIPLSSGSYIGNFPAVTALYDEVNKILGKLNYKLQTVNLSAYKSKDLRVDMQNIDGIVNAADTVTVPTPNAPAPVEPKGFSLSTAATIGYLVWKYL
jgi:hypothetical protein